jgi:hypothetical protein
MNPKRVKINFRLNAETKRRAEKLADSLGISLNDVLSLAVTEYLKGERKRETGVQSNTLTGKGERGCINR